MANAKEITLSGENITEQLEKARSALTASSRFGTSVADLTDTGKTFMYNYNNSTEAKVYTKTEYNIDEPSEYYKELERKVDRLTNLVAELEKRL